MKQCRFYGWLGYLVIIIALALGQPAISIAASSPLVQSQPVASPTFVLTPNHGPCNREIVAVGTNLSPGGVFVIDGPRDSQGKSLEKVLGATSIPGVVGGDGTISVSMVPCTVPSVTQPVAVYFSIIDYNTATGASVLFTIEPSALPGIPSTGAGGMQPQHASVARTWLIAMALFAALLGGCLLGARRARPLVRLLVGRP